MIAKRFHLRRMNASKSFRPRAEDEQYKSSSVPARGGLQFHLRSPLLSVAFPALNVGGRVSATLIVSPSARLLRSFFSLQSGHAAWFPIFPHSAGLSAPTRIFAFPVVLAAHRRAECSRGRTHAFVSIWRRWRAVRTYHGLGIFGTRSSQAELAQLFFRLGRKGVEARFGGLREEVCQRVTRRATSILVEEVLHAIAAK